MGWGFLRFLKSPAIFCRLLDAERGGYCRIEPTDGALPGSQWYLEGSNILRTTFTSLRGEAAVTDFMPVETLSAWPYKGLGTNTWASEDGSCHCLVRLVECVHGEMPLTMKLKVSPNYATSPSKVSLVPHDLGALIS